MAVARDVGSVIKCIDIREYLETLIKNKSLANRHANSFSTFSLSCCHIMAYRGSWFILIVQGIGLLGGVLAVCLEAYAIDSDVKWTNFLSTEESVNSQDDDKTVLIMFRRNSLYSAFGVTWESVALARNSLAEPLAITILTFCIAISCSLVFMYFVLDPSFFREKYITFAFVYGIETVALYTSSVMVLYSTWLYQDLYYNLADHIALEGENTKYTATQKEIGKKMILYMSHCVYQVENLDMNILVDMESVNFCQRVGVKNTVVILSLIFAICNAILLVHTVKRKCFSNSVEPLVLLRETRSVGIGVPESIQASSTTLLPIVPMTVLFTEKNQGKIRDSHVFTKSVGIQTGRFNNKATEMASKRQQTVSTSPVLKTTGQQTSLLENTIAEGQQTSTVKIMTKGQQTSSSNIANDNAAKDLKQSHKRSKSPDVPPVGVVYVAPLKNPAKPNPKPKKITRTVSQQTSAESFIIHRYVRLGNNDDDSQRSDYEN